MTDVEASRKSLQDVVRDIADLVRTLAFVLHLI